MLNVGRLKVLREVAYRGSISAAAEALSYTQSAVSQQVATLEAETGMPLLERHPRGVSLTAAGQTLVAHAEGILAGLDAAENALAAIQGLRGGRLRMASFATAGAALMPQAIAAFRAAYPDVELTLAEGEPEQIVPRLRAGELDLALLFEFADESALPERGDAGRAVRRPDVPRAARLAPARTQAPPAPGGPARADLGADHARERLRAPRRALLQRGRLRAAGVAGERRLPDRPGARRRGPRRGADPPARALGRPRGDRDPRAGPRAARARGDRGGARRRRGWYRPRRRCSGSSSRPPRASARAPEPMGSGRALKAPGAPGLSAGRPLAQPLTLRSEGGTRTS